MPVILIDPSAIRQGPSPPLMRIRPVAAAARAGRLMLETIADCVRRGESFAIETTLSGRRYARLIPEWQAAGYRVTILCLALPDADLAVLRVADRVAQGGHQVPEAVIRRRFAAGRRNFDTTFKALADSWRLYDNAGPAPVLIASSGGSGGRRKPKQ